MPLGWPGSENQSEFKVGYMGLVSIFDVTFDNGKKIADFFSACFVGLQPTVIGPLY